MSRLEKPSVSRAELATLERQVASVSRGPRKKHSCAFFGCAIFLLVFVLLGGWALWSAAASGLMRVPLLSDVAYHPPQPTRVVRPATELFEQELERQINNASDQNIVVFLREETMTASLQTELAQFENAWLQAQSSQVAVLGDRLEFYLPLQKGEAGNALIAEVRLKAKEGEFITDVLDVRVGGAALPKFVARRMVGAMLQNGIQQINTAMQATATVQDVRYAPGHLTLIGTLNL